MSSSPPDQNKIESAQKQLYDEGLKVRYDVAGKKYVDAALENGSSDFARPMQEYVFPSLTILRPTALRDDAACCVLSPPAMTA